MLLHIIGLGGGTTTGLATPTLALSSASGATPVVFTVSSTDYTASYYGQLEIASDAAFTTITQNIVHTPDGSEWAQLDASYGFTDPSGTYSARFRFLEDCPSGTPGAISVTDQLGNTFDALASAWSNVITDTITSSSAVLNSTTGTNKSKYLNIASPFLQFIVNAVVGSAEMARATVHAANSKFHAEFNVNSFQASGGNSDIWIGFDDGTLDLNNAGTGFVSGASLPGGTGGKAGLTLRIIKGVTTVNFYRNGVQSTLTLPSAATDGCAIAVDIDTTANSILFTYWDGTTATVLNGGSAFALTSQIPSSWWAMFGGGAGTGMAGTGVSDAGTANFGGSTNHVTPQSGFGIYA